MASEPKAPSKRRALTILRREFLAAAAIVGPALWLKSTASAQGVPLAAPPPIDALKPVEAAALKLAVRIMLPDPLPAGGPSVEDVVAHLGTFLRYADETTFAALRDQLRVLGGIAPFAENHVGGLKRFVHKQLHQRGYSEVKNALDSLHKVAVLGYYSHDKAYKQLGFVPIANEPRLHTRLRVSVRPQARTFDVAIVGSGVAGSLLAERLTHAGKSVVILESGPYVPEDTLTTDELTWLARLERGSGLQLTNTTEPYVRSARSFPILQGHCVGGGGVINNAICFQMPARRVEQWRGLGFPIPPEALREGYLKAATELSIVPVSQAVTDKELGINRSMLYMEDMLGAPRVPSVSEPPTPGFYECLVNLQDCIGCGRCNTGCGSERKRNALQVHLKAALGDDRDSELVANAKVEQIVLSRAVAGAASRVAELWVKDRHTSERFAVRAHEYVLCAGAIHTPALLLGSRELRERARALPIGERLSAHLVSPVLGFLEKDLHTQPSLQLTHYYVPEDPNDGFMIENLYNPPGQAAVVMAGYGDTHFERMKKYRRTLLVGAVVPTLANGRVRLDAGGRPVITQPLGDSELSRLRSALALSARGMLRGKKGERPSEVIVGVSGGGYVMKRESSVAGLERWLTAFDQVALSTGHPQGGAAMSEDPRIGVVDADFRLHGFANLRVCDASVFPMAAGVNPQWTIMAIANHCANIMKA